MNKKYIVHFEQIPYENIPPFLGMSNIFFQKDEPVEFKIDEDWVNLEYAVLTKDGLNAPIYMIRYRFDDSLEYRVDSDANLDFRNDHPILFQDSFKTAKMADFELQLKSDEERMITRKMQLITDGKWTYCRARDFRRGIFNINDKNILMEMHLPNKSEPFYSLETSDVLFDFDGSDTLVSQSKVVGQLISPSEKIDPSEPFIVENSRFIIAEMSIDGEQVIIEKSRQKEAASIGFMAPTFEGIDIRLGNRNIFPNKNDVTLIEFWSTACPYSPDAHEKMKEFVPQYKDELKYVVVSREDDIAKIDSIINEFPIKPTLIYSESSWELLNSAIKTPKFYLIENGKILHIDEGSKSVHVIERILKKLKE